MGKSLILLGLILVAADLFFLYGGKIPFLGKLPGDIRIEREGFTFFFPLGTCLAVSILISFIFWLFRR
jgi:hypothetical protein